MNKKNLKTQANESSNSIVELSDEDLQQVVGGLRLASSSPVVGRVVDPVTHNIDCTLPNHHWFTAVSSSAVTLLVL